MSHSHNCSHDKSRPHLGEFCPISATGLLGLVAVLYSNKNPYLLATGFAILGLAACRSVLLLLFIINADYRRERGFIPWRCFVLIFPVLLFFFGPLVTSAKPIRVHSNQSPNLIHMTWDDLYAWTRDEQKREWSEGRTGVVEGDLLANPSGRTFILGSPKLIEHQLFRIIVVSDWQIKDVWGRVQVTGGIHYRGQGAETYRNLEGPLSRRHRPS